MSSATLATSATLTTTTMDTNSPELSPDLSGEVHGDINDTPPSEDKSETAPDSLVVMCFYSDK